MGSMVDGKVINSIFIPEKYKKEIKIHCKLTFIKGVKAFLSSYKPIKKTPNAPNNPIRYILNCQVLKITIVKKMVKINAKPPNVGVGTLCAFLPLGRSIKLNLFDKKIAHFVEKIINKELTIIMIKYSVTY
jgi:hypothetical protein